MSVSEDKDDVEKHISAGGWDKRADDLGKGEGIRRTLLDLSFLHLIVDRLLEISFVTVRKSVNVDLRLSLIHGR